jgi:hypothetical protein
MERFGPVYSNVTHRPQAGDHVVPIAGADQTHQPESGTARRKRLAGAAGWLGPWLAVTALALWTSAPDAITPAVAAMGVGAGVLFRGGGRAIARAVALVLLAAAIVTAFAGHRRVDAVLTDFDGYWTAREPEVFGLLSGELDQRMGAGKAAADDLIEAGCFPDRVRAR